MKKQEFDNWTLTIGEADVALKSASRPTIVAGLLGVDRNEAGEPVRLYLDRRIHRPNQETLGGWIPSGAISTILERPPQ